MGWLMELRALHSLTLNPFERRRDTFARRTPAELAGLAKVLHAYVRRCGSLKEALLLGDLNLNHYKRGLAISNLELEDGGAGVDAEGNPVVKARPRGRAHQPPPRPRKPTLEMLNVLARVDLFREQGRSINEAAKLIGISVPSIYNYHKRLQSLGVESPLKDRPRAPNQKKQAGETP